MTSNVKKKLLWLSTISFMLASFYSLLVLGDYFIANYVQGMQEDLNPSKAQLIELERSIFEDQPQRKIAISKGFKPMIFPAAIEDYKPLRDLSIKLGIAPLAPQPNTPLYFCNEGYGMITYTTDKFGFRNANNLWDSKIDLVLIGDSYAHGACVEENSTISQILLPHLKVLNLGTWGNNPIHYAAIAKTFISRIKPKSVAIIFYANDNGEGNRDSIFYRQYFENQSIYFDENNDKEPSHVLLQFYNESEPIVQSILNAEMKAAPIPKHKSGWIRLKKYLGLPHLRLVGNKLIEDIKLKAEIPFSSKLAIDTLVETCKVNHCQPIIVWIPNSEFWRPDSRAKSYANLLLGYSKVRKVTFVDTTQVLLSLGNRAYAEKGPHLSPQGYELVAQQILKALPQPTETALINRQFGENRD